MQRETQCPFAKKPAAHWLVFQRKKVILTRYESIRQRKNESTGVFRIIGLSTLTGTPLTIAEDGKSLT
jgi:hypothetical protein